MKKVFLGFLFSGVLLGGVFQQAQAQDKKQDVNINIGGLTNQSFTGPIFTLGAGADVHLGEHIMISPEFQIWSSELRLDVLQLNLGATLNFRMKFFFIGGGLNIPVLMTGTRTDVFGIIATKINVGLKINRIKFTIYLLSPLEDFFDYFQVGANIGIVFNIKSP
jgi:hypothetical protein